MAISFAAYRAAVDLVPGSKATILDSLMNTLGYDPTDRTTDSTTPVGVGNIAAQAVLEFRHHDGANQLGDEPGGKPGVAHSDYTGFTSPNQPMDLRVFPTCANPAQSSFDPTAVKDPNQWQPLRYIDAAGTDFTQPFVGAQWQQLKPFALTSAAQLRSPTAPALYGSDAYALQARALIDLSAALTDEQKMIAVY
jgi:hypothetical protein